MEYTKIYLLCVINWNYNLLYKRVVDPYTRLDNIRERKERTKKKIYSAILLQSNPINKKMLRLLLNL